MRLAFKCGMVVLLTLAILIPLQMIRGTIHERQQYREQAIRDVGASFGGRSVPRMAQAPGAVVLKSAAR